MSPPIHNIVYTSRASRLLTTGELDSILQDARRFNADHGITGVLFHAQGNFFQFLEGKPGHLDSAMQRIRAARSHAGIRILMDAPGLQRHLPSWHMAFAEAPASELQILSNACWDESIPLTRTGMEKSEAMEHVLSCWSKWAAGYLDAVP